MLYLIFNYFGISFVCFWAGMLFYSFLSQDGERPRTIFHYLLTGLILITAIGQWIALVVPLNLISLIVILFLLFLLSFARKKRMKLILSQCFSSVRRKDILFFGCFLCFCVLILLLNAGPVKMDDTESYHIQMVKWIQEYGSVPGIANLHLRFGFNSSWFTSIAILSYPVKGLNTYQTLNGLLSLWLCGYLLSTILDSITINSVKSVGFGMACSVILVLCLLNWPMIRGSALNANYDFICTCCIIVLFIDLYDNQKDVPIEWLIWPVYLFTVRIMNFPLLLLSVFYMLRFIKPFSAWKLILTFLAAGILIIPFLVRNTILSGYPFFPVYQLDFFSFDWKADKMKLIEISRYIKYYNRVNPMFQPMLFTARLDFPNWVLSWYKYLFKVDKVILTLSFLGYLILFMKAKKMKNRLFIVFFCTMVFQMISWFFIAPDPRFVYGSLLFGIFASVILLPFRLRSLFAIIKYSVVLTSILVFFYSVSKASRLSEYRNFLTPHALPVPAVNTILINHIQVQIPEKILNNWNPRCYDTRLPCLYKPDPRLEARGESIADGFRLKTAGSGVFTGGEYKITE